MDASSFPFYRPMVVEGLTENGSHETHEAIDGQDAINKYNELKPNLVFMDIMMPIKTGLEALKEIKTNDENARIVMCTSVGQEKIIQEAVENGAEDFVTKPFTDC